jgi:formiminoglutamate deiminase
MRGSAQRRARTQGDDFWSWRAEMYRAATALTPESFERVTRVAYRELYRAGVRTVGEFHYVHHQADGTPYTDRTVLADIAIEVARSEGLRIALLRTAYYRAGAGLPPEPGQRRFCEAEVDDTLRDLETLRQKYHGARDVRIGVAPHSVRAVPPAFLRELIRYADAHELMLHMHVSEQPREVAECVEETGKLPVDFLDELGALSPRFVAVHATQLTDAEATKLGARGAYACICATTERDLGDGLPPLTALRRAGAKLCTGIDSHVITDPLDDLRALETHERLRTKSRVTFMPEPHLSDLESPAEQLWFEGSRQTEAACGFSESAGEVAIDRHHPALALVEDTRLLDAIVFSGGAHMVLPT